MRSVIIILMGICLFGNAANATAKKERELCLLVNHIVCGAAVPCYPSCEYSVDPLFTAMYE